MKKVLITGSSGFIGSKLKSELLKKSYEILEINKDSGDVADIKTFQNDNLRSISHVFHLAGKTFVPDSWDDPASFYDVNTKGTWNVLELCRKSGASLTFISAYLYGEPEHLPIPENYRIKPNNPYAHSKYLAEQLCEFYAYNFGVKVCILRPFNVFGIAQEERFLIPSIIKQALFKDQIIVKDLEPKRDYVYADDLIDAILLSESINKKFSIYNIGSGCSVSVKEIIDIVQDLLHVQKPVLSENNIRKNEINNVIADITMANNDLNWFPKYSIIDGLERIINYERRAIYGEEKHSN